VLAWPALERELQRSADAAAAARGGYGLPQEQRAARLAALRDRLFELEVQEERAVEDLSARGISIARRVDANPHAVLLRGDVPLKKSPQAINSILPRRSRRSAYMNS
jgi:hypothetical protein